MENAVILNEIIQVFLADGSAKNVRVDSHTTVKRVVDVVLAGLGLDQFSNAHFALRLAQARALPGASTHECHWLHPGLRMPQVARRYRVHKPPCSLRFELRIRFVPKDIHEMYQTEMAAFLYFYEQLVGDYLDHVCWKIEQEKALDMAALMLKKRFPTLTVSTVEKKLDFRVIEQEGGLLKYLPEAMLVNVKKKHLQKTVIGAVKKVAMLSELECVFGFMNRLMKLVRFDSEVFRACLGHGWQNPIELYVGEKAGVAYKTENSSALHQITKLGSVVDICVRRMDGSHDKAIVRLRVSAQTTCLTITVPTLAMAESLAHLIDGYQMMLSQQPSIWSVQDLFLAESASAKTRRAHTLSPQVQRHSRVPPTPPRIRALPLRIRNHSFTSASDDYAKSMVTDANGDFHLDRSAVRLEELIGDGLFGIVYRGSYVDAKRRRHAVAVKVCKDNGEYQDFQHSNKYLLEEAHTMQQFRHPHIIKFIGICTNSSFSDESESDSGHASSSNINNNNDDYALPSSVWMVMELAPFGELRQYLHRERSVMDLSVQILFAKQLASAVSYLHARQFVHRDIAARNCLVTSPHCIKLSDFGMSKLLEEEQVYTSSSGKLPIKWMAPESLNFRKFTPQSDVYSLGVCVWEILMHGEKPWTGIRNHDVIKKIEAGETLQRPPECPEALYDMLQAMWVIDDNFRLSALETLHFLEHLCFEIDRGVPFEHLSIPDFHDLRQKMGAERDRRRAVPVLRADASKMPTATLWRAVESSRAQCEEDERWLEEDDCHEPPVVPNHTSPSAAGPIHKRASSVLGTVLPRNLELDRASDSIHEAVLRVVQSVAQLTKTYTTDMSNDVFVAKIADITDELSRLFAESNRDKEKLSHEDRKKVLMVEGLLGADLKNMTQAMAHVVHEGDELGSCNYHRLEVLKTAHILAVNCKHFLDSIDEARIRCGIARLRPRSPLGTAVDC